MAKSDIGLIGLAVMGQNLALNMARNKSKVTVFNRTVETTRQFMAERGEQAGLRGCETLDEFIQSLESPRRVFLMIKAGPVVDRVIEELKPLLDPGDLIIDGGNSHYLDTERRYRKLTGEGFRYLGVGVSGGEEGALKGPAVMTGGDREAHDLVAPLLTAVSAKVDGQPCMAYMGRGGAGHLVKMVHNGIEYGDMQLIAEAYDLLHHSLGAEARELHQIFSKWNSAELASYLIAITADIFKVMEKDSGKPLVEMILDSAGQKGTGRWTVQSALDLGVSVPTISAAVEARIISSKKAERVKASQVLSGPEGADPESREQMIADIGSALYAAKICSYAQGFALMKAADREYGFGLNPIDPARVWRGGCIIRSVFLNDVMAGLAAQPDADNLMLVPFFTGIMNRGQAPLRRVVAFAVTRGVPCPAMAASLGYFDSYRASRLPANLLQAQRDYFGAHTYQRLDQEGVFHTDWLSLAKDAQ